MFHRTLRLLALVVAATTAHAGPVVVLFSDGRTLEAADVERRGLHR